MKVPQSITCWGDSSSSAVFIAFELWNAPSPGLIPSTPQDSKIWVAATLPSAIQSLNSEISKLCGVSSSKFSFKEKGRRLSISENSSLERSAWWLHRASRQILWIVVLNLFQILSEDLKSELIILVWCLKVVISKHEIMELFKLVTGARWLRKYAIEAERTNSSYYEKRG